MKRVFACALLLALPFALSAYGAQAGGSTSRPQISQVNPSSVDPGAEADLTISGGGFDTGCYVTFSNPAIRVLSTRFDSPSRLETKIKVGDKAEPGTVTLYVANAAGNSASASLAISAAASGTASKPPVNSAAPTVSSVSPGSVTAGTTVTIKIKGKNFAKGAAVSFSNPGIEVLKTDVSSPTGLSAQLKTASDAQAGACGLFVVNPDESEVEVPFSVTAAGGGSAPSSANSKGSSGSGAIAERSFKVINLGDAISVFQKAGEPEGELILSAKNLEYDEQGKKVFSVPRGEIKEVASNVFFGINTGTFHIILNNGKTYNFIASSFNPQATQAIVDSLQGALR